MSGEWPIYSSDNACRPFFSGPIELSLEQVASVQGKRILITGCGSRSTLGERMVQRGAHVSAVDISLPDLQLAARRKGGVDYVQADATSLPFPPEHFEISVSVSTLQYMDIGAAIKESARVMKNAGTSIFIENLESCPIARLHRLWRRIRHVEEPENMVIRRHLSLQDVPEFQDHFSSVTVTLWHDWTTLLYPFIHGSRPYQLAASGLVQAGGRPIPRQSRRARLAWIAQIVAVR